MVNSFFIAISTSSLWDTISYDSMTYGGVINYLLLLYVVITRRVEYYIYLTILMSIMALILVVSQILSDNFEWIILFKYFIPCIGIIYLSYWLEKKLCPLPKINKENYLDKNGLEKVKVNVEFEE